MRISPSILVGLLVLAALRGIAQDVESAKPECFEPSAQTFDEFVFTTPQDLKGHAKLFEDKLREHPESQGVIFVYGGKKSKISELSEMSTNVNKAFTYGGNSYESKIWIREGGYRAEPTVVFMLRPLKCTEQPLPSSDLSVDQVEFSDFPASSTIRTATSDLYTSVLYEPEAECPAAAKAVRACVDGTESEVFIIVNAAGAVVFSKTLGGHPLIRASAESIAKTWYFHPYKDKSGKPMNRSGVIVVRYGQPAQ
ncbi:MAG: hypothetical protein ABJA02_15360 [Acidobacteriota bacterium]